MLRYTTPSGAAFTGVKFGYTRVNGSGLESNFYLNDAGGANVVGIPGLNYGAPYQMTSWFDLPAGQRRTILRGVLKCDAGGGCSSGSGMTGFYNVNLKIDDFSAPSYVQRVGGNLIGQGTVSGTRTYEALGYDGQSGVAALTVYVNSTGVTGTFGNCVAGRYVPCDSLYKSFSLNTTQPPFAEGLNSIYFCAHDYLEQGTGNVACSPMEYFTVDN